MSLLWLLTYSTYHILQRQFLESLMQFSDRNVTTNSENAELEYQSWLYFRGNIPILHYEILVCKIENISIAIIHELMNKYVHILETGQCVAINKNGTTFEMAKLDCNINAYFVCQVGK